MQNSLKDVYSNLDLYGSELFITMLKDKYKLVSYTNKAIPTAGSATNNTHFIREDILVDRAIFHKNNNVTVFFICPQHDGSIIPATATFLN